MPLLLLPDVSHVSEGLLVLKQVLRWKVWRRLEGAYLPRGGCSLTGTFCSPYPQLGVSVLERDRRNDFERLWPSTEIP